ncbi:MAG: hypothetical protein WC702_02270 [Patescibacteria group bacterium]
MERLRKLIADSVNDWQKVVEGTARMDEVIGRRRDWILSSLPRDKKQIDAAIPVAVSGFRGIENGVLYPFSSRLGLDSRVSLANTAGDLIDLAVNHFGGHPPDPRRSFEALVLLDVSIALAMVEKFDPFRRVNRDLQSLVEVLFSEVFSSSATEQKLSYCFDRAVYETNQLTLACRDFGAARIYFEDRPKERFAIILKLFRDCLEEGEVFRVNLDDRRAIRITVVSGDFSETIARLEVALRQLNAVVYERTSISNYSSGPGVKGLRRLRVRWHSKAFEFQLASWEVYLAMNVRPGPTHHLVYEASRLGEFLKVRYPQKLFGIRWEDGLEVLREFALARAASRRY